jgi:hypothetical protein
VREEVADKRGDADIRRENDELKVTVASLEAQLEAMKKLNADREMVGRVRPYCTPVSVVGPDSGERDSLSLSLSQVGSLERGMPVVYSGGLVGRVARAGPGGAQVQLVTDKGFKATGLFGRFVRKSESEYEFQRTATEVPLVEGLGKGVMAVRNLKLREVKDVGLKEDDWVLLDDVDWPMILAGQRMGRIVSIRPRTDAPLMAEIRLQPMRNLLELREVMVMTKTQ